MLRYLGLYRYDVALISFFSYLIATLDATGALVLADVMIAFLISAVSFNFVYTFNSWSDWRIDQVNKPHRPIPSGRIKPRRAALYSLGLLVSSVTYPFLIQASYAALFLVLSIPLLGLLYSAGPRLKRNIISANTVTSLLYVIPVALGVLTHSQGVSSAPLLIGAFIFCMAIIPLKDIEDVKGDGRYGCGNWLSVAGKKRLLAYSVSALLLVAVFLLFSGLNASLNFFLFFLSLSVMTSVVLFCLFGFDPKRLYKTIIKIIIAEGLLFFTFTLLFAFS
jgi:geranylgeranylglycerol-phosphate geranylgeranyltransferase